MNVIVWLEFKLAHYNITIQYISHNIMGTPLKINCSDWVILVALMCDFHIREKDLLGHIWMLFFGNELWQWKVDILQQWGIKWKKLLVKGNESQLTICKVGLPPKK